MPDGQLGIGGEGVIQRRALGGRQIVRPAETEPARVEQAFATSARPPGGLRRARRPPGQEGLGQERAAAGIAEGANLAEELGDVGAAILPAILEVADVGLEERRAQATRARVALALLRRLGRGEIVPDGAARHPQVVGDALDAPPLGPQLLHLLPAGHAPGAGGGVPLLRPAGGPSSDGGFDLGWRWFHGHGFDLAAPPAQHLLQGGAGVLC